MMTYYFIGIAIISFAAGAFLGYAYYKPTERAYKRIVHDLEEKVERLEAAWKDDKK